jgi:hypothetical protein
MCITGAQTREQCALRGHEGNLRQLVLDHRNEGLQIQVWVWRDTGLAAVALSVVAEMRAIRYLHKSIMVNKAKCK